jgi:hypothetical protein
VFIRLFVNLFGGTDEISGKPQPEFSKYGIYKNVIHQYPSDKAKVKTACFEYTEVYAPVVNLICHMY